MYRENHNIKDCRAWVFDYGGTLDTGGCHWGRLLWWAWQQTGIMVDERTFREAYVYVERYLAAHDVVHPDDTFRQTLSKKLRLELQQVDAVDKLQQVLDIAYTKVVGHTRHSRDVLQQLAVHKPLALVTNFYGNIHTVLHEFGMDRLFAPIIESAVVGVRKPDPRIFLLAVEALGCSPEDVVVVGDSYAKDIVPAHLAGCRTVWLCGEQWDTEPVSPTDADIVISDLNELLLL